MGLEHLWILVPTAGPGANPLWIPREYLYFVSYRNAAENTVYMSLCPLCETLQDISYIVNREKTPSPDEL